MKKLAEFMTWVRDVVTFAMELMAELRKLDEEHGVFLMEYYEERARELGLDV